MDIPPTAREIFRRRVLRYFMVGLVVDLTVILSFATHPAWLQYFYSERFPMITKLIFGVFFLGLGVTYVNFVRLVREEGALIRAARTFFTHISGQPDADPVRVADGLGSTFVGLRVADLAEAAAEGVDSPADAAGDEVAAREEIHSGLAKYVTAILTMLGLVGTFLGLIIAIDGISEISAIEDREAFVRGVKAALDGMGTAFATSLAGIFGAIVLGFEQLMFHFAQVSFLARLDRFTGRYLEPLFEQPGPTRVTDVLPGAGELAATTEALRAWRAELERVQADLSGGVRALVDSQTQLGGTVGELAAVVGAEGARLSELEEKLDELRWYVGRENATLLGLVGHVAGERSGPGDEGQSVDPDAPPPASIDPERTDLAVEMHRTNDLLARIYGELGMAVRSATFKLEEGQATTNRKLAKLIQRIESTATSSAEQIHMLRTILGHVGKDDERLSSLLETLRSEARHEDDG
jgi:hypothetical protein